MMKLKIFILFFDSIVNKDDSSLRLAKCLCYCLNLQQKFINNKWFKRYKINKIKKLNDKALTIIHEFNQNTVY